MENLAKSYYQSPVGLLEINGTEDSIISLLFLDNEKVLMAESTTYVDECVRQLDEYFAGKRKEFELNLIPEGTEFQKKVWKEILTVQYGMTKSYLEISKSIGDVLAIRAVANAHGQNKIPIIIPCHRVIGSDGSLTGFGGGLWRKKWLLEHEQRFSGYEAQLAFPL
jgi:methylated-DNA-[protein]-cysteine S-methyltransferase